MTSPRYCPNPTCTDGQVPTMGLAPTPTEDCPLCHPEVVEQRISRAASLLRQYIPPAPTPKAKKGAKK